MADKDLIKRWVEKAEEYFGYASLSLKEGIPFFLQMCWRFQHAARSILMRIFWPASPSSAIFMI